MKSLREFIRQLKRRVKGTVELHHTYQTIFDDETMTVFYKAGSGQDLILSFTGVGHSTGGIDLQTPEFSKSGFQNPILYVIDKHRSWGNSLNWAKLETIVRDKRSDGRLILLGNSMGGFLAILAASRLNANISIAFAPQWSVCPEKVPFETRWMKYRKNITQYSFATLENSFSCDCHFHIFCGSDERDVKHLEMFPSDAKNLKRFQLAGGGHSVSAALKEYGILYQVIAACIEHQDVDALLFENELEYKAL
jgi:hypothetical protein